MIESWIYKYRILNRENYFAENGLENYLLFQQFSRYLNGKKWFMALKNDFF